MNKEWYKNLSEEQKQDYCLYSIEALASIYNMVLTSYQRLTAFCSNELKKPNEVSSDYLAALADAWMFIDSYALFDKTIYEGHLLIKDSKSFKSFHEIAKPLRECRNYHYHFNADNQYIKNSNSQVFGNFTWVTDEEKCVITIPSLSLRGKPSFSIVFDSISGRYVSRKTLIINDQGIDFDYYFEQLKSFKEKLLSFFNNETISSLFDDCKYCSTSLEFDYPQSTDRLSTEHR